MGITIHYKGSLNDVSSADEFITEVTEISLELNWEFTAINDPEKDLKGIVIKPHKKSESLSLLINSKGILQNIAFLSIDNPDTDICHYASIKTQYAPLEIHIAIIKLLKYLNKKYISNLKVVDEGQYWETEDVKVLQNKMKFLNDIMDVLADELAKIPADKNESPESIADKIEKLFKDKMN